MRPLIASSKGVLSAGGLFSGYPILVVLVAGYAALNRSFAYLRLGPLYITELCLGILLVLRGLRLATRPVLEVPKSTLSKLVLLSPCVYIAYGVLRVIPDLLGGAALASTLRNFAVVYYAAFAPLGYAAIVVSSKERATAILTVVLVFSTLSNSLRLFLVGQQGQLGSLEAYTTTIGGHAALFAVLSAITLIGSIERPYRRARLMTRALLLALMLLQVTFVYLSAQRSGLVSLVAGVLTFIVLSGQGRVAKLALVAGVGSLLVVVAASLPSSQMLLLKYSTLFGGALEEPNALWRFLYWIQITETWKSAPILGVGFAEDLTRYAPWAPIDPDLRVDPHNSYLTVLVRSGLVGLVFLTACLMLLAALALRNATRLRDRASQRLPGIVLGCFVAVAVYASANVTLENPYHGMIFWFLLGVASALLSTQGTPKPEGSRSPSGSDNTRAVLKKHPRGRQ